MRVWSRRLAVIAGLALLAVSNAPPATHAGSDSAASAVGAASTPISLQVEAGSSAPLVAGLLAEHLRVVVRNQSPDAVVALRGLAWSPGGRASIDWHGPVYGSSHESLAGDRVVMDELNQALTSHAFEQGVLLPGEALSVLMPLTPQQARGHLLDVAYVQVSGERGGWRAEVLVPEDPSVLPRIAFVAPTEEIIRQREGKGGIGLLRATMSPGAQGPQVQHVRVPLELPVAQEADAERTGGLTPAEAAGRAGAIEEQGFVFYYRPSMQTWFFIRHDGMCRALRREGDRWVFHFLSEMPVNAPEFFGSGEAQTPLLLNPEVFGERVEVMTPWTQMYYNPGETHVDARELWEILRLAEEKKLPVDLVTMNPNGLGVQQVLAIGVKVDSAGRWIDPAIPPRDVPLNPR
jgi:hypothetical protein